MWGNATLFHRAKSILKSIEKRKILVKAIGKNIEKKINIDKIYGKNIEER